MQRFEEVKNKVERTRQTLSEAAERVRKHEELKSTIDELKARTEALQSPRLSLDGSRGGPDGESALDVGALRVWDLTSLITVEI